MRDFKKFTSTKVRQEVEHHKPQKLDSLLYPKKDQVFKVWKDRFDELYLESRALIEIKLSYIHNNPLQSHWDLCVNPEHYLYSNALFYYTGKQNDVEVRHYMNYI